MQDVHIASENISSENRRIPLPLRNDTMLGVCAALGEDLGFNPNYLRVVIGSLVIFNITWAVVTYLTLGIIVAASRLLFPQRRQAASNTGAEQAIVEANDAAAAPESIAA